MGADVDGTSVVLVSSGGSVRALPGDGPHLDAPLAEGTFSDRCLTCGLHEGAFDGTTGVVRVGRL